jgi:thiamine biosynthesis lipoprotein
MKNEFIFQLVIIILISQFIGCSFFPEQEITKSAFLMNTLIEIEARGSNVESALTEALKVGQDLSKIFNRFDDKSEIHRINRLAGVSAVKIRPEVLGVISRTNQISSNVGGLFDITIGPLIDLWSPKDLENPKVPSADVIARKKTLVNFKKVEVDLEKETVGLKDKHMYLDLGGVAKGYLIDRVRGMLLKHKTSSALINGQSSMAVIGKNKEGDNWRVGIQHPRKSEEIIGIITLKPAQALSTSGDYQKYFELNGKRYHHIINPRSGYPASGCQSVTIVGDSAERCDILSTAVFIMGPKKGMEFIESQKSIEGVIVDAQGSILTSSKVRFER